MEEGQPLPIERPCQLESVSKPRFYCLSEAGSNIRTGRGPTPILHLGEGLKRGVAGKDDSGAGKGESKGV